MVRLAFVLAAASLAVTGCSSQSSDEREPVGAAEDLAVSQQSAEAEPVGPGDEMVDDKVSPEPVASNDSASPPGRIVDCLIVTNGDDYEGPCRFFADSDGSFSLSLDDESPIVDRITMVSVSILEPGQAEVRGLTTDGINSRWGPAMRDAEDRACWNGTDFTICAY